MKLFNSLNCEISFKAKEFFGAIVEEPRKYNFPASKQIFKPCFICSIVYRLQRPDLSWKFKLKDKKRAIKILLKAHYLS